MVTNIILVVCIILLVIGIIRIIIRPYDGLGNAFLEFFLIDLMFDIIGAIIESLGDST